jgi:hypothetical protein
MRGQKRYARSLCSVDAFIIAVASFPQVG